MQPYTLFPVVSSFELPGARFKWFPSLPLRPVLSLFQCSRSQNHPSNWATRKSSSWMSTKPSNGLRVTSPWLAQILYPSNWPAAHGWIEQPVSSPLVDRPTGGVAIMPNKKVYLHCKMRGRAKQAGYLLTGYLVTQMVYQGVVVQEETFGQLVAAEICDVVMLWWEKSRIWQIKLLIICWRVLCFVKLVYKEII